MRGSEDSVSSTRQTSSNYYYYYYCYYYYYVKACLVSERPLSFSERPMSGLPTSSERPLRASGVSATPLNAPERL